MRMHRFHRALTATLTATALTFGVAASAQAQDWPTKPITMIVPFPAGGPTDLVARLLGNHLGNRLGQTVVVDNRGGANGTIGMQAAARANADGYTILYNTSSISLSPNLYRTLSFDPKQDFAPISTTATVPMVLLAHPSVPADTAQEFIAHAKANPGKLSYGSAGAGNVTHLTAFLFAQSVGIDAIHVPYRGSAPAMADLVGGQTQFMLNTLNDSLPFIRDNRLKALAITSSQRSDLLPDVPTLAETVMPGFDSGAWQGVAAPANTPQPIVERLNREIRDILASQDFLEQLARQGTQPLGSSPEEYRAFIASEIERWGQVTQAAGVQLD